MIEQNIYYLYYNTLIDKMRFERQDSSVVAIFPPDFTYTHPNEPVDVRRYWVPEFCGFLDEYVV